MIEKLLQAIFSIWCRFQKFEPAGSLYNPALDFLIFNCLCFLYFFSMNGLPIKRVRFSEEPISEL